MEKPAPPDQIDPAAAAFFLDFDGTLSEIVSDPAAAGVTPRVAEALASLFELSGGAVAIISGRSLEQLDGMLRPLSLPAAGVHGLERRTADGSVLRARIDPATQSRLRERIRGFAADRPRLVVETKPGSVALHYRNAPELKSSCQELAERLCREEAGVRMVLGKMVVELKLADRTKADAITEFMLERPFLGRRPVFAGDDVTDEDAFRVLSRWGGISIKIGREETDASYRCPDIFSFHAWLLRIARLDGTDQLNPT